MQNKSHNIPVKFVDLDLNCIYIYIWIFKCKTEYFNVDKKILWLVTYPTESS